MEPATSSTKVRWQEGIQVSSKKRGIQSLATKSRPVAQIPRKRKTKVKENTIMSCHRQVKLNLEKKRPRMFLLPLCLVQTSCSGSRLNSIGHMLKVRVHVMLRTVRTTIKN